MSLLMALSGVSCAALLLLTSPRGPTAAVDAAAMGWPPRRIAAAGWAGSAGGAALCGALGAAFTGASAGIVAAAIAAMWLPWLVPSVLRAAVLNSYGLERDMNLLEWFRRMRLLSATGLPINAAAVEASMSITGRGFTPAQGRISAALAAGSDPLAVVLDTISGSPAEPLLQAVISAERSGAASTGLLDRTLARTVRAFESDRRQAIDGIARSVAITATLTSVVTGLVVLLAVMSSL
ncbi:MAG: type II secretion system F family protein [bacterium]|nr:type II secretion system F family protein [bacterium]